VPGTDSRLTLYGKQFQTIAAMLYMGMINDDEAIKQLDALDIAWKNSLSN